MGTEGDFAISTMIAAPPIIPSPFSSRMGIVSVTGIIRVTEVVVYSC
jgi:hypothetical protein